MTYTGPGDTYGTVYEVDCGNLRLAYSVSPDDSTEYLFRLSTSTHYDQSGGTLCTPGAFTADTASPIWKRYTLTQ